MAGSRTSAATRSRRRCTSAGRSLGYAHLPVRDRVGLGRAALALQRLDPSDPALDAVTFGEWLAAAGQSAGAIDKVWNLIALPTLNVDAHEASLALAAMVFQTGLLSDSSAADIGWSRVPLVGPARRAGRRALAARGVQVGPAHASTASRRIAAAAARASSRP